MPLVANAAPPARRVRARVSVVEDASGLADRLAQRISRLVCEGVRTRSCFRIALAGGATPRALYARLARPPHRSRLPWQAVQVFWTDERCVPAHDPTSNYVMARETLLNHVEIPKANIPPVPVERGTPTRIAFEYDAEVRHAFGLTTGQMPIFDLVLLGVGADGHVASLFPGSRALSKTHRVAVASVGGRPRCARVSLTLPVLSSARRMIWLVTGSAKAAIVRRLLETRSTAATALPAQRLQRLAGPSEWWLDRAAARLLRGSDRHGLGP